jgi:hypothetical protein
MSKVVKLAAAGAALALAQFSGVADELPGQKAEAQGAQCVGIGGGQFVHPNGNPCTPDAPDDGGDNINFAGAKAKAAASINSKYLGLAWGGPAGSTVADMSSTTQAQTEPWVQCATTFTTETKGSRELSILGVGGTLQRAHGEGAQYVDQALIPGCVNAATAFDDVVTANTIAVQQDNTRNDMALAAFSRTSECTRDNYLALYLAGMDMENVVVKDCGEDTPDNTTTTSLGTTETTTETSEPPLRLAKGGQCADIGGEFTNVQSEYGTYIHWKGKDERTGWYCPILITEPVPTGMN